MRGYPRIDAKILIGTMLTGLCGQSSGQQPIFSAGRIYDDSRIRAQAYPLGTGALNHPLNAILSEQNQVPFGTDGIVGLSTMIYTDNGEEAFPSHRLQGWFKDMDPAPPNEHPDEARLRMQYKAGTWAEYFRYSGTTAPSFAGGVDNLGAHNFFAPYLKPSRLPTRTFSSTSVNRGYTKVEYICPSTCGSSNVSTYYFKLKGWSINPTSPNSASVSRSFALPTGLSATDIVGLDAVIHSDGGQPHGYIVDNISHNGQREYTDMTTPARYGKGGGIWFGRGCEFAPCGYLSSSSRSIRVFAGTRNPSPNDQKSSYVGSDFSFLPPEPGATPTAIPYVDGNKNRGWVKIEYTNKSLVQPAFAIKSKAVAIGPWQMHLADKDQVQLPLSDFGISADRIVGMNTTIQSDPVFNAWNGRPGWQLTDFNMHKDETREAKPGLPHSRGGGFTLVKDNTVHVVAVKKGKTEPEFLNYYSANHSRQYLNDQCCTPFNRGWVRIDYLAGACEQGGSGFLLKAIPSSKTSSCTGTGNLLLEGAGADVWGSNDEFTFVYKSINASNTPTSRTFQAKVESQAYSEAWAKTGVMVRMGTDAGSPHISMMVTPSNGTQPSNGIQFTKRGSHNGSTSHVATVSGVKAPVWLRVVRNGNTYSGWYSTDGSSWKSVGPSTTLTTSSTYYAGVAATSRSTKMNTSVLSGLQF